MRFEVSGLLLIAICGVGACEQATSPPAQAPSTIDSEEAANDARNRRLEEEAELRIRQREQEAAEAERVRAETQRAEQQRAIDEERAERARQCEEQRPARAARLAELEPKVLKLRADREEAARTRPEDEKWVRANCRWENDPRYALEVERRRRAGETEYVVNERFAGFSRSVPKCPKGTSPRRLQIAAAIGNGLVDRRTAGFITKLQLQDEDKAAGVEEYDRLMAEQKACDDIGAVPVHVEPGQL